MSQTFANSINGNPIYAERAEQDKNGLDIAQYYAKLADMAAISFSGDYDDLINKPQNLVQDASYVHTDNNFTNALKDKLDGIEAGAEVNVQPDWLQSDSASDDYIKNKPTISNVPFVTSTDDGKVLKASYSGGTGSYSWETAPSGLPASTSADEGKVLKVDANGDPEWDTAPASQVQADWTESDTTDPSYIQNKPQNLVQDASYVHTDNNFTTTLKNKLNGIAAGAEVNVQADWNQTDSSADDFIKNKPTIPNAGEPLWNYTAKSVSITGSGSSHRFVINDNEPKCYYTSSTGYTHDTNYTNINIRENANAMKHDWTFRFTTSLRHFVKVSIYDSSNALSTRYIMHAIGNGTNHVITPTGGSIDVTNGPTTTSYGNTIFVEKHGNVIHVYAS